MTYPLAVMRLGAPHEGHLTLIRRMLAWSSTGPVLILVGSAQLTAVPAAPLPWQERKDLLLSLLTAHQVPTARLVFAPIGDIAQAGFCCAWFLHLMDHAYQAMGEVPGCYFYGNDYQARDFALLTALFHPITLQEVVRELPKSGTELRQAISQQDPLLIAKYSFELKLYPQAIQDQIRRVCLA